MRLLPGVVLAMSAVIGRADAQSGEAPHPTVLRVTFDNATRADSVMLTAAIRRGLVKDSTLVIVERPVPPGEVGRGAQYIVMAHFLKVGAQVLAELRAVDALSERILAHESIRGVRDSMAIPVSDAAQRLARKVAPP